MDELLQIEEQRGGRRRVVRGRHVRALFGDLEVFGAAVGKYRRASHLSGPQALERAVAVARVVGLRALGRDMRKGGK